MVGKRNASVLLAPDCPSGQSDVPVALVALRRLSVSAR